MDDLRNIPHPFDSAFKTLAHDCPQLMIPLVNEIFGTTFSPRDEVVLLDPKQLAPTPDGGVALREVDSLFTIVGERTMTFHVECQSRPDDTMVARFWEYDAQIAMIGAEISPGGRMRVRFPRSAVLYLRHGPNTPDCLTIEVENDRGETFDLREIPIVKTQRYTLDELFDKGLYFLLPFYAFTHERRLPEYEADERELDGLLQEIESIKTRLEDAVTSDVIDGYERSTILDMALLVMYGLANRQKKTMKGVERSMGGVIVDHQAKRILNKGIATGVAKGRAEGIAKGELKTYIGLVRDNIVTPSVAASRLHISESEFMARCETDDPDLR